jgi:hypothetical protein
MGSAAVYSRGDPDELDPLSLLESLFVFLWYPPANGLLEGLVFKCESMAESKSERKLLQLVVLVLLQTVDSTGVTGLCARG